MMKFRVYKPFARSTLPIPAFTSDRVHLDIKLIVTFLSRVHPTRTTYRASFVCVCLSLRRAGCSVKVWYSPLPQVPCSHDHSVVLTTGAQTFAFSNLAFQHFDLVCPWYCMSSRMWVCRVHSNAHYAFADAGQYCCCGDAAACFKRWDVP